MHSQTKQKNINQENKNNIMWKNKREPVGFKPSWMQKKEEEKQEVQEVEVEIQQILKNLNLEHLNLEKELHEDERIRKRIKELYSQVIHVQEFIKYRETLYNIYNSHLNEQPKIALQSIKEIEQEDRKIKIHLMELEEYLRKHIIPETDDLIKESKIEGNSANQLNILIKRMIIETTKALDLINSDTTNNVYNRLIISAKDRMKVLGMK